MQYGHHLTIRRAKLTDWPDLYHLMHSSFCEIPPKLLSYHIYMTTFKSNMLVLTEHRKIVGMASYNRHKIDTLWVDYLLIHPGHRNKGFATKLLQKLIDTSAEYRVNKLALAVLKNNQHAIKLYNKCGFEFIDEEPEKFILSMPIASTLSTGQHQGQLAERSPNLIQKVFFKLFFYIIRFFYQTRIRLATFSTQ